MARSLRVEPTPDSYIEQAVENRQQKKSSSLRIAWKLTTPSHVPWTLRNSAPDLNILFGTAWWQTAGGFFRNG
jgi:hypothetical protein